MSGTFAAIQKADAWNVCVLIALANSGILGSGGPFASAITENGSALCSLLIREGFESSSMAPSTNKCGLHRGVCSLLFAPLGFIRKKNHRGRIPMDLDSTEPEDRGTALAQERTDLAIQRTRMAADRSLMAWIRTALSMIGFGFTIYKFFQYMPEELATGNVRRPQAPRNFGLTLIALGTLALAAAAWQHLNVLRTIRAPRAQRVWPFALVVALLVILIGLITFYGVLLRSGPF
jgi:putative membrane protein